MGVINLAGVGGSFPWAKLFEKKIYPYVRSFAVKHEDRRPDKVIIVLDKERRTDCCGLLASEGEGLIARLLESENLRIPVNVVLANPQIESWLLANTSVLDGSPLFKTNLSAVLGDETDGKNVLALIKGNLKPGCGWDKQRNGKELAKRLNLRDEIVIQRSRSLRKFVKVLS